MLDSLKTVEPKVLAGMAAIEQDEFGKQNDFELSVTFLLPSCPVVAKNVKAKDLGANVSSSDSKYSHCLLNIPFPDMSTSMLIHKCKVGSTSI